MKIYLKIIILIFLALGTIFFVTSNLEEFKYETRQALKVAKFVTVCDETLYYSLGSVDSRFNLSIEEIKAVTLAAEGVWEQALGKNVFEYREGAEFKINFIFDERQQSTVEKNSLDLELDKLEQHKDNISQEYLGIQASYKKAVASYEKKIKNYEEAVDDFNAQVKKWDEQGGAPADEYDKLKKEEKSLDKVRNQLEQDRKAINGLVTKMNALATKEGTLVENYNKSIETYKDKFGESREFNQGEYVGTEINIYQFHEQKDLKLVIAHELGHALTVGHVENPQSLMYYLMDKQDLENIKLTQEDLTAIKEICKIK